MSEGGKFEGMEEMDDFTVRGAEGGAFGPEEDITGAAGIERPLDPAKDVEDDEPTLRPRTLDEFVGQEELKQNLRIFVEAAKRRGEALTALGYTLEEAERALKEVPPQDSVQRYVKEALRRIGSRR